MNKPPRWLGPLTCIAAILLGWSLARCSEVSNTPDIAHRTANTESTEKQSSASPAELPIPEATTLVQPGDVQPELIRGHAPALPHQDAALIPTITCRVLIAADGRVERASIFRSRLELADYEHAALNAVRNFLFSPPQKSGVPTAAWLNYPVTFRATTTPPLRVQGSNTIGGKLLPELAREFQRTRPDVHIDIQALGSSTAFTGLLDGLAEIGASSRSVRDSELARAQAQGIRFHELVLAYDGIAIIVHESNPVRAMTQDQMAKILRGDTRNWNQIDTTQPDKSRPVVIYSRPPYSGTHQFVRDKLLRRDASLAHASFPKDAHIIEDTSALAKAVASDPNGIGYVSLEAAMQTQGVRTLAIQSAPGTTPILPTQATVQDGSYSIYRPLFLYIRQDLPQVAIDFLQYLGSDHATHVITQHGFIPVTQPPLSPSVMAQLSTHRVPNAQPPKRVYFHLAQSYLDKEAVQTLKTVVSQARRNSNTLSLRPHADVGTTRRNRALAERRVHRIQEFLLAHGIAPRRINIDYSRLEVPMASNATAIGRDQNRCVDILELQP